MRYSKAIYKKKNNHNTQKKFDAPKGELFQNTIPVNLLILKLFYTLCFFSVLLALFILPFLLLNRLNTISINDLHNVILINSPSPLTYCRGRVLIFFGSLVAINFLGLYPFFPPSQGFQTWVSSFPQISRSNSFKKISLTCIVSNHCLSHLLHSTSPSGGVKFVLCSLARPQ